MPSSPPAPIPKTNAMIHLASEGFRRAPHHSSARRPIPMERFMRAASCHSLAWRVIVAWLCSLLCIQAQVGSASSSGALAQASARAAAAVVPPAITLPLQDMTALVGDKVVLRIKATGSKPLTYQWFKDNVPIPNQTRSKLTLTAVTANDSGKYTVEVSNPAGSPASSTAQLTVVTPQLSVGLQANSMMILQGVKAPMNVTVGRTPGYKKPVKLSISGLPSGVSGSFAPASLGATKTVSILRLTVSGSAPIGTYLVTVAATAPGANGAQASFTLYIQGAPPAGGVATFTTVQPWGTQTPEDMETTNSGVYVHTQDAQGTEIVWRGSSPAEWTHWDFDEFLYSWRPSNLYNEAPSEFNVAWVGSEHFGSAIMNIGVPPFSYERDYMGGNGSGLPNVKMTDYLPGEKDWAVSDEGGIFFDASNGGSKASTMFDFVDKIEEPSAVLRDPNDDNVTLYAGGHETLYQIDPFDTTPYDLSAFGTNAYVNRIEYAAERIWISYAGKILTLKDGVLSQFADASTPLSGFGLDNFCVANGQVYASNGLRYPISGGPGVPWIVKDVSKLKPGSPEFQRYLGLLPITSGVRLHALKDAISSPIYAIHDNKLYIIHPL